MASLDQDVARGRREEMQAVLADVRVVRFGSEGLSLPSSMGGPEVEARMSGQ